MIESFRETARRTGQTGITRVVAFDTCVADEAIAVRPAFRWGRNCLHCSVFTIWMAWPAF